MGSDRRSSAFGSSFIMYRAVIHYSSSSSSSTWIIRPLSCTKSVPTSPLIHSIPIMGDHCSTHHYRHSSPIHRDHHPSSSSSSRSGGVLHQRSDSEIASLFRDISWTYPNHTPLPRAIPLIPLPLLSRIPDPQLRIHHISKHPRFTPALYETPRIASAPHKIDISSLHRQAGATGYGPQCPLRPRGFALHVFHFYGTL